MKFNPEKNIEDLTNYGFVKLTSDYLHEAFGDPYDTIYTYEDCYMLNLGHSRRGQFYYFIVHEKGSEIYASKPDGDGCGISLDNTMIKLIEDKMLIANEV